MRIFAAVVTTVLVLDIPGAEVGAASGPSLVRNISTSASSNPRELTAVGQTLFFSARGAGGRELWKSDGTLGGTVRVKNINPGSAGSAPRNLTNVAGTLFLSAFDGTDQGLWTSDGTPDGTHLVEYVDGDNFTSFNGRLFFSIGPTLWRSNGTAAGTFAVKSLAAGPDHFITEIQRVGNRLYVALVDLANGDDSELWISNGLGSGTTKLADIFTPTGSNGIHTLTRVGDRLFFLRDEEGNVSFANSAELWTSNGSGAGTKRVKDFVAGDVDYVFSLVRAHQRAFFFADGKLWKSDGSVAGTKLVSDVGFEYGPITNVAGVLYFAADTGLWTSDGTTAGTEHVTAAVPFQPERCQPGTPCPEPLDYGPVGAAGQLLYPSDQEGFGIELWMTDGTSFGSHPVIDIRAGPQSSHPADLMRVGEAVFFTANDGIHGRELWRYVP